MLTPTITKPVQVSIAMHVFPVERMIAKVSQPNAFTGSMFNTTRAMDDAAPIDRMTAGDLSPVRIGEMRLDVSSVGVERSVGRGQCGNLFANLM